MSESPRVEILGVRVDAISRTRLLDTLVEWVRDDGSRRAYYANAHALNLAWENGEFQGALNEADLVYCDGYGVKWAGTVLGQPLPERMTPPDWIDQFLARLGPANPVFLLGDEVAVVSSCAQGMSDRHPNIRIAGSHHGFFDPAGRENEEIVDLISRSGARVLLVGMGMPRQELWIDSNLAELDVSLALPVGALFRYYTGLMKRAPRWVTNNGLEWIGRLVYDPVNTYRRYLRGNPRFVARVLRERLRS